MTPGDDWLGVFVAISGQYLLLETLLGRAKYSTLWVAVSNQLSAIRACPERSEGSMTRPAAWFPLMADG
jgi:hypothetical protein